MQILPVLPPRREGWPARRQRRVERVDEEEPGVEDLIDRAAVGTFRTGGQVFSVDPDDVPDGGALAAIYRF